VIIICKNENLNKELCQMRSEISHLTQIINVNIITTSEETSNNSICFKINDECEILLRFRV
jgi:hypothetical protein